MRVRVSDYLSDEEQVERLKSWWSENGTFLLASVFVAVLGIAGWNYYGSYQDCLLYTSPSPRDRG